MGSHVRGGGVLARRVRLVRSETMMKERGGEDLQHQSHYNCWMGE